MIDDNTFLNKPNFTKMVENKVLDTKQSYMDAVLDLCDKLDIDPIELYTRLALHISISELSYLRDEILIINPKLV